MQGVIFTLNTLMTSSWAYHNLWHKGKIHSNFHSIFGFTFRYDNTLVISYAFLNTCISHNYRYSKLKIQKLLSPLEVQHLSHFWWNCLETLEKLLKIGCLMPHSKKKIKHILMQSVNVQSKKKNIISCSQTTPEVVWWNKAIDCPSFYPEEPH